ncbi:MAG TPA: hypothetical protein VF866_00085 [Xanthobacteraceae bacterium]
MQESLDIVADHAGLKRHAFLSCSATEEFFEMFEIFLDAILHKAHPFSGDILQAVDDKGRTLNQRLNIPGRLLHGLSCSVTRQAEQFRKLIRRSFRYPGCRLAAVAPGAAKSLGIAPESFGSCSGSTLRCI